jgi:hypothetical protein
LKITSRPPSLISSLMAGFDVVSNHISLILFSVFFDLVIWFGPRLRIAGLFEPVLAQSATLSDFQDARTLEIMRMGLERLNLFVALRSFPVGVPSLMVGRLPAGTPLAIQPQSVDIVSLVNMLAIWGMLLLIGIAIGTFYFSMIAQASLAKQLSFRRALAGWPRNFIQVLMLTFFMYALIMIFLLPLTCLLSGLMFLGVGMNQLPLVAALFMAGIIIWILVPLFFSPHGIFAFGRSMWQSTVQAFRLSRATFSATSMFILVIVLLSEGLNVVWNLPRDRSWFMIVGIAGHAFITAGLLASTFIFYRDANVWLSELVRAKELNQAGA